MVFALFTLLVEPGGAAGLDHAVAQFVALLASGHAAHVLELVYPLGTLQGAGLMTASLCFFLLGRRRWGAALLLACTMLVLLLIEALLRVSLPTPAGGALMALLSHPRAIVAAANGTYPSGHTARVVLFFGCAASLLPRRLRAAGLLGAFLLGLLMAAERVSVGAHTGSDVLGGLLLGSSLAASYAVLYPVLDAWRPATSSQ